METRHDFRSAPVPIRLTCQYSNGITLSYYARALTCNEKSLRVLTTQRFERNIKLNVLAPFLSSVAPCCVSSSKRSKTQAWLFELDLEFLSEVIWGRGEMNAEAEESDSSAELDGFGDLSVAASELATHLERSVTGKFSEAWRQLPAAQRPAHLVACVPAVQLLLQEKGKLDLRASLRTLAPSAPRIANAVSAALKEVKK